MDICFLQRSMKFGEFVLLRYVCALSVIIAKEAEYDHYTRYEKSKANVKSQPILFIEVSWSGQYNIERSLSKEKYTFKRKTFLTHQENTHSAYRKKPKGTCENKGEVNIK